MPCLQARKAGPVGLSWPQGGGLDSGERRNTVGVKVVVPALSAQRVLGLPSPGLKAHRR